jgi:hypothetical protein
MTTRRARAVNKATHRNAETRRLPEETMTRQGSTGGGGVRKGYLIMPAINVILYDVVPPETRASASATDGVILSAFSALTAFAIGAVSHPTM